jgi:hypothetical protein
MGGAEHALGTWPTIRQAAIAHDRALLYFGLDGERTLNFPKASRQRGPATPAELRREGALERRTARRAASARDRTAERDGGRSGGACGSMPAHTQRATTVVSRAGRSSARPFRPRSDRVRPELMTSVLARGQPATG